MAKDGVQYQTPRHLFDGCGDIMIEADYTKGGYKELIKNVKG
jgi:hypothetical protein